MQTDRENGELTERLLAVIEHEIVPATRVSVARGNKVFGAAMLRKSDLSTIVADTNHETENPLWHGEVYTIKRYYDLVHAGEIEHVAPGEVLFLATHEPCTLCASAIAWCGFDNFYYLFSHEDSRDSFEIGHDLNILQELYGLGPGEYRRQNAYWSGYSLMNLVDACVGAEHDRLRARIEAVKRAYAEMSAVYQARKADNLTIPLK